MRRVQVTQPKGVVHQKREYCRVCVLLKSALEDDVIAMLKALTKKVDKHGFPLCKETKRLFKVVIGNNLVENVNGHLKAKLRKAGLLGRATDWMASVNSLYAAHLLRSPGFETALTALASYRKWIMTTGVHPKDAFGETGIKTWLRLGK